MESKSDTNKHVLKSTKAGLIFPVGRIRRHMKKIDNGQRIGASSPVFLAAVMETLMAEMLECASKITLANNRTRITTRDIMLAIDKDEELKKLLENCVVENAGVPQYINPSLLPSRRKKLKKIIEESVSD